MQKRRKKETTDNSEEVLSAKRNKNIRNENKIVFKKI
jgi:hypothetical protein